MKMVIRGGMGSYFFFFYLIMYEVVLQYYGEDVIKKCELAQGKPSSGLGIKVRPVGRRGNCLCNREGKIAVSQ